MPVKSKNKKNSKDLSSNLSNNNILLYQSIPSFSSDIDELRRVENKVNDLKTIILMINTIDSILASSENEKWIELADLTDKINRHAKDLQTIRNTYGELKSNGICWQDIYHIKVIATHKPDAMKTIRADLLLDLPLLKNKLLFILKDQSDFISNNFEVNDTIELNALITNTPDEIGPNLKKIEANISREYSLLIIERIKLETNLNINEFTFSTREDKYFLARKLTIIGELLNQLSTDNEWKAFVSHIKDIIKMRDLLVHENKKLLNVNPATETLIGDTIKIIFSRIVIAIDSKESDDLELLNAISTLYKFLDESLDVVTSPVVTNLKKKSKEKTEETLEKFIAKICSSIERNLDINKLESEYLNKINGLDSEIKATFPNTIFTEESKLKLQNINEKNKLELQNKLAEEERSRKEKAIAGKISIKLNQIEAEFKFLGALSAYSSNNIKHTYIYEHSINVIGDLIEQIRDIKEKESLEVVSARASNTFKLFQSSNIHLRKNGLSHDIFSFSSQKFDQLVLNDILPAHDDVRAVNYILSNHGVVISSVRMMNNVGTSYIRLGMYEEAIKTFQEAKEYILKNPEKIKEEKMKSCGVESLVNIVSFMDLDEVSFGIDSYAYEVTDNLITAYTLNGSIEQANNLTRELIGKINFEEVIGSDNKLRDLLASTINMLAKNLYQANKIEEAKYLYEAMLKLSRDKEIMGHSKIGLMDCLVKLGNHELAKGIKDNLELNANEITIFMLKMRKCVEAVEGDRVQNAVALVDEMSQFLITNEGVLKGFIGDRFFLLFLKIIDSKLKIFDKESERNIGQLNNIENEFNERLKLIPASFQEAQEIENTYLFFSSSYLGLSTYLINNKISDGLNELKRAKEYSNKAISISSGSRLEAYRQLAVEYSNYDTIESLEVALDIEKAYKINNEITHLNYAIAIFNLAESYSSKKELDNALPNYQKAIDLIKNLNEIINHPEALKTLGTCYERFGEINQDTKFFDQAIATYNQFLLIVPKGSADAQEVKSYIKECEAKKELQVELDKVEEKVIYSYKNKKQLSSSFKVYGIEKENLRKYFKVSLGADINISDLPTKKGYLVAVSEEMDSALKILSNKHSAMANQKVGLLCIDASMDSEYVRVNDEAFEKFGNNLFIAGKEFSASHSKLFTLENDIRTSDNIDYSTMAFTAQQGLRFYPTVKYFFKILGVNLPEIEISSEAKGILDFALGMTKINANTPDNKLVPGQIIESASYFSGLKIIDMINTRPVDERPNDLYGLLKACSGELSNGLVSGISIMSPIYTAYGLVSGSAQCLSKYNLFQEEGFTQSNIRIAGDFIVGIASAYMVPGNIISKSCVLISNVVMTDISIKVAFASFDIGLSGVENSYSND